MSIDDSPRAGYLHPERVRLLCLVGWVAAANAVAVAFAVMPASGSPAEGARALLAWCGIG